MKAFKFNLESLYKLRQNIEKKRQAELAVISAKYNKEREAKDNCILKIKDSMIKIDSIEDSKEMLDMSLYIGDYIMALKSQMNIHEKNMDNIGVELRKRQLVLQEASKDRRAVELLKEKKLEEYRKQLHKDEQSKLDEWKEDYIAVNMHAFESNI